MPGFGMIAVQRIMVRAIAFLVATAFVGGAAVAQDTLERPWLNGLPLADISLNLPEPRVPDLEHDCSLPDGLAEIAAIKSDGVYSDPTYLGWLEQYYTCDYAGLTKAIESNLVSGNPHAFADVMWATIKRRQGQLTPEWDAGLDPELSAALGPTPELYRLYHADETTPAAYAFAKAFGPEDFRPNAFGWHYARWLRSDVETIAPDILLTALERNPNEYVSWWNIDRRDARIIEGLKALTGPGGTLSDHFFAPVFMDYLIERRSSGQDRIELSDAWLARFPTDRFALVRKAGELAALNRNEQAAEIGTRAAFIAPFSLYLTAARYNYEVGQFDRGDAIIALRAGDAQERLGIYVEQLESAHYAHQARALAKRMISDGTAVQRARTALRNSYSAAKQTALKVEQARLLWQEGEPNWTNAQNLIGALNEDGLQREALDVFADASTRLGTPSWPMIQRAIEASETFKDTQTTRQLIETAKSLPIAQDQVLRAQIRLYERLEEPVRVVGLSRELVQSYQAFRSDYVQLYKAAYKLQDVAGFNEAFTLASRDSLNSYEAHYGAINAAYDLNQTERASELIDLAKAAFPDRFFPVFAVESRAGQPQSREDFQRRMDTMVSILPRLAGEDREWAARNIASLAQKALSARIITPDEAAPAAGIFETYLPEMNLSSADRSARPLYGALGKPEKAVAIWREMARNVLDAGWPVARMNIGDEDARDEAFQATWRTMTRNRFDDGLLREAVQVHGLYGGSSIFAVCLSEWVDQNYPQAMPTIRGMRDKVSSLFGGDDEYFRRNYNNVTNIRGSENYINWYHSTKRKALAGSGFVDFDCDRGVVTTVDRNGRMKVRQDDYRSGKLLLLAEGASWVRYEYRDQGDLVRVSASDGREIRLEYNAADKIERMIDSEQGTLDYVYNEMGKPISIAMGDIGTITVAYDAEGNIEKVESPEGQAMALRVTQAFQNLLSLVKPENNARLLNKAEPEIQEMAEALASGTPAPTGVDVNRAADAFEKVRATNHTASRTMDDIDIITQTLLGAPLQSANAGDFAAFGSALHALYVAVSPFGLPDSRWLGWTDFLRLAEARADETPIARMLADIRKNPLTPMVAKTAVNLSELRNPGYWYVDTPSAFIPPKMRSGIEYSAVALRPNADKVAGSSVGLLVQRKGNWRRYAFDAARNAWKRDDLAEFSSDPITISSFAELPGNRLAIGTNRGIYVVGDNYTRTIDRAGSGTGGLAGGAVNDLYLQDAVLHVASTGGVSQIAISPNGELGAARTIGTMKANRVDAGPQDSVLVAAETGLWIVRGDQITGIASLALDDAAYSATDGRVLLLSRGKLLSTQMEDAGWSSPVELTHGASARLGTGGYALERVEFGGVQSVAALGQDGFAIWQDGYFEHFELPYSDTLPAATAASLASRGGLVAGADGALYRFEPGRIRTYGSRPVLASAYDDQNDLVFFADGARIIVVPAAEPGQPPQFNTFDRAGATHLDIAPDGALIANDANTILRYPPGELREQVLFEAQAFCPDKAPCNQSLEGLLAASDGSVWATVGASAFRWKDGEVTEYSYFKDPLGFPVRTNWLSDVIELPDGGIVISASNQGYVDYRGEKFDGQNLVFRNGRFEKFENTTLFTSSTSIEGGAILGSLNGFYEADMLGVQSLVSSEDQSYVTLRDRRPNLYLGGQAAKIGSDTLLFPTPAGIVVYQNGNWFYPERINWQYPDPSKADIGGRHTYAVEVDKAGRIYAATDQGLVIFQHLGGDAEDFLMENARPDLAFSSFERRKFRRQVATLLDGIDPGSEQFIQFDKVRNARKDIDTLRANAEKSATPDRGPRAPGNGGRDGGRNGGRDGGRGASGELEDGARVGPAPGSRLAEAIRAKEREYTRLLAELERDDPGLAQLVTIQPLELAALQDKVPSDAVIVQYIPQGDRLHIHVVGKGINHVEQVDIGKDTLMNAALDANFFLEDYAPIAEGLITQGNSIFAASDAGKKLPPDSRTGSLEGLYEVLIAPIEAQLEGAQRVYISAAGALNYVPFAALTRVRDGKRQYAVERYNFAMVPTSYLLSLVLNDQGTAQPMALIYGNPDGTLPYAEQEAANVQSQVAVRMSDVILRTGSEATLKTLEQYGSQSGLLHLATHGRLDPVAPERSHLVLGGDRTRLDAVDIMTLDLSDVELVFLSACETGRGGDGLEFATLARAFSHAGVPTTIASLWKVGDQSTLGLVEAFYSTLGEDSAAALSAAQREMIATSGPRSHPAAWAAFQVYGRGFSSGQ